MVLVQSMMNGLMLRMPK